MRFVTSDRPRERTTSFRAPGWRFRLLAPVSALAVAVSLSACGSSSSSSSASTSSTTATGTSTAANAVPAHPTTVRGVPSPSGAVKPSAAALKKLVKVAKGAGVSAHLGGLSKLSLDKKLGVIGGDLNQFWSGEFAKSSLQWPQVQQVLVTSSPVQTQCSSDPTVAPTDHWLLCWSQTLATFYWPLTWIQQNVANQGDVSLAFNMAQLFSFLVQDQLGFTQQAQQGSMTKANWAQQSTCLTGIYVRSLNDRKLFEQGDQPQITSFLNALTSVGGVTNPDVTPQQLQQAFVAGFNSGDPASCGVQTGGGTGTSTTPAPTTPAPTPSPTTPPTTTT